MSFEAPPLPRGKRDMKKDLEQREHKNPINMSDHDITEESYNIAVQRNKNYSAFTKEQEARQGELFEESSNRIYEKTYGHRPPSQQQPPIAPSFPSHTTLVQEQLPTEIERQAKRIMDFTHILNDPKTKARGIIMPRERKRVAGK
jgi:hypothetical protein